MTGLPKFSAGGLVLALTPVLALAGAWLASDALMPDDRPDLGTPGVIGVPSAPAGTHRPVRPTPTPTHQSTAHARDHARDQDADDGATGARRADPAGVPAAGDEEDDRDDGPDADLPDRDEPDEDG